MGNNTTLDRGFDVHSANAERSDSVFPCGAWEQGQQEQIVCQHPMFSGRRHVGHDLANWADMPSAAKRPCRNRRRGAVIIVVMVCFLLAGVLFAALARIAAAERQTDRLRHWKAQAAWLTEAAMERAVAKLRADPNYAGETWAISPKELSGRRGAAVRIAVESVVDQADRCRIKVEADFPDDPRNRCRLKKEIVVERDGGDNPFKSEKKDMQKDKSSESKEENK